jgi:hypothetical protein
MLQNTYDDRGADVATATQSVWAHVSLEPDLRRITSQHNPQSPTLHSDATTLRLLYRTIRIKAFLDSPGIWICHQP